MSRATKSMSKMWLRARLSATGLLRDRSGIAATEFAVIVPMMLVMFFGTVEFSIGVAIDRKVTLMARALVDMTSQAATVNDADIANFRAAGNTIMMPYAPPLPYPVPITTISELYIDSTTGVARVQWSQGDAPRAPSSTVVIPPSLIALDANGKIIPNQYLLYSEVNFVYKPAIDIGFMPAGVTLRDIAYTRPRQSTCVFYPAAPAPVPPATQPACPTA
jgi:Flp pilus assembly protein TadG